VPSDFKRYAEVSNQIRAIFFEYTDLVEPLSLDEAYLDVTINKKGNPSATLLATEIREKIKEKTGLTASAGISINKFLAKVASDINKPNGQKTIAPEEVSHFLEQLDIKKFYGVGKVTVQKMYNLGIFTGLDLKQKSKDFLTTHFGKSGAYYYQVVRGIHTSEVKASRIRKSLAAERTFSKNITSEIYLLERLTQIAAEVASRLKKNRLAGKTITLKIKYSDFSIQTRSKTIKYYISDKAIIMETVKELLFQEKIKNSVRLLGISLSNLNTEKKNPSKEELILKEKEVVVQLQFDF
jgi:DNA polymerase-4